VKIAVVHNQPTGGARRALHGFGTELAKHNRVDVFTLTTADSTWLADDYATHVWRQPLVRHRPVRFGLYVNDWLDARDRRDLGIAYGAIAGAIDADDYDVALVDACRFSLVPPVLTVLRTPSVYYAHNGPAAFEAGAWGSAETTWAHMRNVWHEPFTRRAAEDLAAQQRANLRAATVVAANSHHTRERLHAAYGVDAIVSPPGILLPSERPSVRRLPYVLSVGEIEPRKGFAFLLGALSRIHRDKRPLLRVLANDANPVERAALEGRARADGTLLDIRINPPRPELEHFYAEASLFVYAARHEALGLAPLEAMAHGTPVVAVGEGGLLETVIDGVTGALVPRDPGAFACALQALLDDEVTRVRMGMAAHRHVAAHWSQEACAAVLEDVLAGAASMRTPARAPR
jgi:glycosyltransferase involved in cell wall biosynthesis